jgi:hypothetical protein
MEAIMKQPVKRLLFWTPRVLTMLYAAFISMFALDVFGEGYGFWGTILALMMHLIPTGLILLALAIAWRWEWVGALLFIGLASWYTFWAFNHPSWILVIAGPAFLVSVLFLINWLYQRELRAST